MRLNFHERIAEMAGADRNLRICTCCARRSAGCSGMSWTWCAGRSHAAIKSAWSATPEPAASMPHESWMSVAPLARARIVAHPDAAPARNGGHLGNTSRRLARRPKRAGCGAWPRRQRRVPMRGSRSATDGPLRVYTPHGGSLLFRPGTPIGALLPDAGAAAASRAPTCSCSKAPSSRASSTPKSAPRKVPARIVPNGVARSRIRRGRVAGRRHRSPLYRRVSPSEGRRSSDRCHGLAAGQGHSPDRHHCRRRQRRARNSRNWSTPARPAIRDPVLFANAGARSLRTRAHHGGAVARGILSLYRARSRRRREAAGGDQCRRHSRHVRTACRSAGDSPTTRARSRPRSPMPLTNPKGRLPTHACYASA